MKLIIFFLLCFATLADVTHHQSKSGSNAVAANTQTFASTVTAGHGVWVFVKWVEPSTPVMSGVTDDNSNTYTCGTTMQGTGTLTAKFVACYDASVTGGAAIAVTSTLDSAPGYHNVTILDVSGHDSTQPDVALTIASGNTGTGYTSAASITTTVTGDLLVSQVISSGSTPNSGTGWTAITGGEGDIYDIVGTAGAYPALRTDAGSQAWNVTNYAIKASGGTAAPERRRVIVIQ